jgi:HAD superfamily hydrolase (TIGR01549 family)
MDKLKPDAILFDMDGVLVDSLDSWWAALDDAMRFFKQDGLSREEFVEKYWGQDLYYTLEKLGFDPGIVNRCNLSYENHIDKVKIHQGVKETLERLDGIKKGIVTNTPRNRAFQIVRMLGIEQFFDTIVTSDDVSRGKPSPEIVFKACKNLGVEPEKTILVGDTRSDVDAGHDAGCRVFGIDIVADYTIKDILDLVGFLEL